ncbi:MAG: hypothetical protein CVU65_11535 [Deltaproteobacteria bacterium HGW-Deltaproteobacteria-22]|jgi:hypothetical protein|nr:MAG: hypothetical protein CVU65_11535 [Deltaproteobacteria bacterium HGW-Deltaproteobacteria-22]
MKKFITLFTVLFSMAFAGSAMAQDPVAAPAGGLDLKVGTIFAGGTVGFSKQTMSIDVNGMDDIEMTTIEFAPSVGYFVTPEIAAMGTLIYRSEDDGDNSQSTIGFYAGARYHMPMGKFYLWGSGELGLLMVSEDATDTDTTAYGLRLGVGILFPFNPHVALEAGLKFSYMMGSMDGGGDSVDISVTDFGLGYFGFVGYFNL